MHIVQHCNQCRHDDDDAVRVRPRCAPFVVPHNFHRPIENANTQIKHFVPHFFFFHFQLEFLLLETQKREKRSN